MIDNDIAPPPEVTELIELAARNGAGGRKTQRDTLGAALRRIGNSVTEAASAREEPDGAVRFTAAPDITTLTVSNTDAGLVSFRIVIPNRATFSSDMLIALETHNRRGLARLFLGSVADKVVRAGTTPVLVHHTAG